MAKPMTINVEDRHDAGRMSKAGINREPATGRTSKTELLGLDVETAEDGAGVKVIEVKPDSAAADRGISAGDVILEVAGTEVNSPPT